MVLSPISFKTIAFVSKSYSYNKYEFIIILPLAPDVASELPPDFPVALDTLSAFFPVLFEEPPVPYPPTRTVEPPLYESLFPECVFVTVGLDMASIVFDSSFTGFVAADVPSFFNTSNFFVNVL